MKLVIIFMMVASSAFASDYFHECRNASGSMIILDGGLETVPDGTSIDYDVVSKQVLESKQETCYSPIANRSYEWGFTRYLLKIRFSYMGSDNIEEYYICEEIYDGTPAGISDCR